MKNKIEIKLFISCPSDVDNEKEIVKSVCNSLSRMLDKRGILVQPIHWKEDVVPQITGEGSQKIINTHLKKSDYDIYIGILWKKFGDPQENGLTPTEEEFEYALKRYKKEKRPLISVFFKKEKFFPESKYDTEQLLAVQTFSDRIENLDLGLYKPFVKKLDFQKFTYETIHDFISKLTEIELEDVHVSLIQIQYEKVANYLGRKVCPANKYRQELMFFGLDSDKYDLLDLLDKENKIVIIGDAGVGKTVELQRIASHFSQGKSKYIPFFIKLNQYVNQKIEDFLPDGWQTIADYNLLLILDGLDEIESKNKRDAIREIELFSEQHPAIKIIVSCRTNFYQSGTNNSPGTLSNFRAYTLLPIEFFQIEEYIKTNLSSPPDDFLDEIRLPRLTDLLYIPFYLIELVKLYNSKNKLPDKKSDLFDEFIKLRIESDKSHYRTTIDLQNKRHIILNALQKIALGAETLGRNNITNEELERIIPDVDTINLLKHCSLINKVEGENTIWQFEHNNIQEFLAAKLLSQQFFDIIKSFISFAPDYKKIIPSWLNTVAFIFSLVEEESFKDWILENEPDITVKFEPDKIDRSVRIKIFKKIFEDHKSKRIWIDRDKYSYDELARFGQDDEIIKYLLDELESATHYTIVSNAIEILAQMKIPFNYKDRLKDVLVEVAVDNFNTEIPENVQQDALMALSDLKYDSKDIVEKIVTALKESDNDWVRYGLYYFLHNSNYLNEYIDIFLDGIKYVRFNTNNISGHRSRLYNEKRELIQGLKMVSKNESIKKMFNYFMANSRDIHDLFMGDHDITFIADNAARLYTDNQDLLDISLAFVQTLLEGHHKKEAEQYATFFEKTGTKCLAFQKLLSIESHYKEELLSDLATQKNLDYTLNKYDQNKFAEKGVWRLLNTLRWRNKPMFEYLYKALNEKYDGKFILAPSPDWGKIRKKKSQKEFDLLFNKNNFIAEIKLIYEKEGKHSFSAKELLDIKEDNWSEEPYSDLAIRKLRNLAEKNSITFSDAVEAINKFDWDWFAISHIYEKLKSNSELIVSDAQKEWIEKWCLACEKQVDFKTAITKTGENSHSVRWDAIFLWYFYRKYELEYSKSTLFDMLSFDQERKGIEYLEKTLSKRDITERIITNLHEGIEISYVLKNHLEYCSKNKIKEALPFAFIQIKDEKAENEIRRISLELILNIKKDLKDLENTVCEIKDDFKWEVIENLLDKSDRIYDYLRVMFQRSEPEDKIKLCDYLINFQDIDALAYYVGWIKDQNKFDSQMYNASYLPKLKTEKAIPHLIELLGVSYQKEFQQPDQFYRLDRLILEAFKSISLESQDNYRAVKQSIETFITNNIGTYKNVNWLYSFLNQLEQQYYVNLTQNITIDDVLEKLALIKI